MSKRITDHPNVEMFVFNGNCFCELVENYQDIDLTEFLQKMYKAIISLISSAPDLPDINISQNYDKKISYASWRRLYKELKEYFSDYNTYLEMFDPYDFNEKEPVSGSLADDISSIYRDIKPGLKNWLKSGASERRNIVWSWKLDFELHWGEHATSILRALYYLLFHKIDGNNGLPIGMRKGKS